MLGKGSDFNSFLMNQGENYLQQRTVCKYKLQLHWESVFSAI